MGGGRGLPERFEFLRELGGGGAGDLLLVRDTGAGGESRALKILRPRAPDPGLEPLFRSEFLLLSEIRHEAIVRVHDFGVLESGEPFFSMDYVPGENGVSFVERDRLESGDYLDLAGGLLEALAHVHARGILHRDVKPANVIMRRGDGRLHPVLVDFGLAVTAAAARPREAAGTLPYIAPEVLAGAAPDPRADLFALGALLYGMATGRPVAERQELLRAPRAALAPDRVRKLLRRTRRATVPRGLDDLVAALLDPEPVKRPRSAVDALELLDEATGRRDARALPAPVRPEALGEAPLVGRTRALEALGQRLDALREGHLLDPVVVVAGPAGHGVTRLLATVRNQAAAAGCVACAGTTLRELAHGVAAHPRVGGTRPASPDDAAALVFRLDAMLHDLPVDSCPVLVLDEVDRWSAEACDALRDWVAAIERRSGRARLLLALGGRSDAEGPGAELLRTAGRSVPLELRELGPLSVQDVRAALVGVTGRVRIPGELAQTLARASGGSPRLLDELLHLLVARGVLAYEGGEPVLHADRLAGVELPHGVEEAARRRAEGLGDGARDALALLAAIDGAVPWPVARHLWPDALDDLVREAFVVRDRGRVRFPNEIARRAHDTLRGAERRRALRDAGTMLVQDVPDLAARVLWNAGRRAQAREVALPLVRSWLAGGRNPEAIGLLETVRGDGTHDATESLLLRALLARGRAVDAVPVGRRLVERGGADEDDLFAYVAALTRSGAHAEALERVERGEERAPEESRWRYANARAALHGALEDWERAFEAADEAEERAGTLFAHGGVVARVRANLLLTLGRRGAARRLEERVLAAPGVPPPVRRAAYLNRSLHHQHAGHAARAMHDAHQALVLARSTGHLPSQGRAHYQLGRLLLDLGRAGAALRSARHAVACGEAAALRGSTLLARVIEAAALLALGRPAEAEAAIERVETIPGADEEGWWRTGTGMVRARAAHLAGRAAEAQERARELVAGSGADGAPEPLCAVLEAEVVDSADPDERERLWRLALRFAWRARATEVLPRIRVALAESAAARGVWKLAGQLLDRDRSRQLEWKTPLRARALVVRAAAALQAAQPAAAGRHAEEAIAVANRSDAAAARAFIYEQVAALLEEPALQRFLRRPTGPASSLLLEAAREAWTRYGNETMLRKIDLHLSELPRAGADPLSGPDADRLVRILHITREMNREFDRDRLLGLILDRAIELTGAERGFVVLLQEGREEVHLARNIDREAVSEPEQKISSQIIRDVIRTGRIVRSENAEEDERFEESFSVRQLRLKSIIAVPFRAKGRTVGLLYLDNRFRVGNFDEGEERLLELFADQAVAAIEKAALVRELEDHRRELEHLSGRQKRDLEATGAELDLAEEELRRHRRDRGWGLEEMVARSVAMQGVQREAKRFARSRVPVLITGEAGVGKELLARAMHFAGPREKKPFLAVSCAGLDAARLEAELFGHVRGASSDEEHDRAGAFEQAAGGTLYLEEAGELPLPVQARLLQVVEHGEVQRVGDSRKRRVDVRVTASSSADLDELIRNGRLREDLYLALAGVVIEIPPLRERREDIEPLAYRFVEEQARAEGRESLRISNEAIARLEALPWPGNVRELRAALSRAVVLCEGAEVRRSHIQPDARSFAALPGLDPTLADRTVDELKKHGADLNRRQERGLLLALTRGKLEFGEYLRLFSISKSTTARDLDSLISQELLEKRGKTRAVVYLPGPRLKKAAKRVGAI